MIPLKCAFKVRDLPKWFLIHVELVFAFDSVCQWLCVFTDNQTAIQLFLMFFRYPRKALESLAIVPWTFISVRIPFYSNAVFKIVRFLRVKELFEKLENSRVLNYSLIRFLKLMSIQLYCAHIVGCMFYHLATNSDGLPKVEPTWMSHIQFGDKDLTQLGILQKYVASVYFAIVTLSTVGYGDIYAVNVKEMVAVVGLIIFSLIVWSYLGVNFSDLFVRRSRARIVRDKLDKMEQHLRDTNVPEELATRIRDHMVIKYNDDYDKRFLDYVPASIRTRISRLFNESIIRKVSLFRGCSAGFIQHLASEVREDFYAPGYNLFEAGSNLDYLCILFSGDLEQLVGGNVLPEHILPTRIFGIEPLIFDEPLPNTFRARTTSKILLLHKHYLVEALEIYLVDAATVMENLRMRRDADFVARLNGSKFGIRMQKDEIEKASLLNRAVFSGNFYKVKTLVGSGVNVNLLDYNRRSPLHVAATTGNREIANFLIQNGAERDTRDLNGTTPLLEAIKNGNDGVAVILGQLGATLGIDNAGEYLCKLVSENDLDLLKRLLKYGIDPNATNHAGQTPLHIAALKSRCAATEVLLAARANPNLKDRWGHEPLHEAKTRNHTKMIEILSREMNTAHGDQA